MSSSHGDEDLDGLVRAERKAVALFAAAVVAAAVVVAGITIAGWGGGTLNNRIEPLFWAGAILGGVALALLGLATLPRRSSAIITALSRAGILLFLIAPTLCIVAMFIDYWI
jgi:hypothetical protein